MTNKKLLDPRLAQYVDYINNTGQVPLAVKAFDEDWEPIGPRLRAEMEAEGYIYTGGPDMFGDQTAEGIYLRPDLKR